MGTAICRVTGIALALLTALLGAVVTVLLYYAGQDGLMTVYMDEKQRIRKPTDDWYGIIILRGWAFGFIYVIPGITGITASLFSRKLPIILHFIIGVLALVAGSFLHTIGACAIILYRVFLINRVLEYDNWPSDCKYVRKDDKFRQEYLDEGCVKGRRASMHVIATVIVAFVAWLFLLSHLLYCGFTFHNIGKDDERSKKTPKSANQDSPRQRHYRRLQPSPSDSTETTDAPATTVTNTASDDTGTNIYHSSLHDDVTNASTTNITQTTDGAMGQDVTGASGIDSVALEMVQVQNKGDFTKF